MRRGALIGLSVLLSLCMAGSVLADKGEEQPEIRKAFEGADELFATIHEDLGNLGKAQAIYEKYQNMKPFQLEATWRLAEIQYFYGMLAKNKSTEKKYYKRSQDLSNAALVLDPNCVPALFYSGCSNSSLADMAGPIKAMGLLKRGKLDLGKAIEAGSEDRFAPLAASVLSQVNTETPWPIRNIKEAEKLSLQAVAWDSNLTMASIQLATVYFYQKQYPQAAKEARRCLSISQPTYLSDAVLWDWPAAKQIIADVEERVGN